MQKSHLKKFVTLLLFFPIFLWAEDSNLVPSLNVVKNLNGVVVATQNNAKIKVLYPKMIPHDAKSSQLFANSIRLRYSPMIYNINIDSTATCAGARYCNVGSIRARSMANPNIHHDNNDQPLTTTVTLANGLTAYYTPGHTEADYWPPMIEWRSHNTLYTLTWNIDTKKMDAQKTLVGMANAALK